MFFLKKKTATIENGKERSVRERVRARGSAVMKVKGQLRMGHGAGWVAKESAWVFPPLGI